MVRLAWTRHVGLQPRGPEKVAKTDHYTCALDTRVPRKRSPRYNNDSRGGTSLTKRAHWPTSPPKLLTPDCPTADTPAGARAACAWRWLMHPLALRPPLPHHRRHHRCHHRSTPSSSSHLWAGGGREAGRAGGQCTGARPFHKDCSAPGSRRAPCCCSWLGGHVRCRLPPHASGMPVACLLPAPNPCHGHACTLKLPLRIWPPPCSDALTNQCRPPSQSADASSSCSPGLWSGRCWSCSRSHPPTPSS